MGLIKRIENGETTVRDADDVKNKIKATFLIGIGVGIVLITIAFAILGS